ncbi:glycine betaine ABC transporter substrate-binding protein, partial [Pseudomonas syringae group genomosp. 3]|uniref:glycine betaine ABC transporter substrate-binding protein n=1 Tax=Pseudomonas syringae group genomosp. 3 TaxID=251701 RepID=UPI0029055FF6
TSSLAATLHIGVSAEFSKQYPELVSVFKQVDFPIGLLNQTLSDMSKKHEDPKVAATRFLKQNPDVWKTWLPADVASRVSAAL